MTVDLCIYVVFKLETEDVYNNLLQQTIILNHTQPPNEPLSTSFQLTDSTKYKTLGDP